ncbi:MAG: hypothetical protein ABWZ14_00985 [Acidimicrobiales bacterium]
MEMPPGPPVSGPSGPPPLAEDPSGPADDSDESTLVTDRERALADEAANRRLVATIAAVALVVVAAMIGAFLLTRDHGGSGQEAPDEANPPLSVPTATSVAEEPVDEAALDTLIPDLQAFVEEERGLEFQEDIDLEILDDAAYADRAESDFAEDLVDTREDLENSAAALQALGLWPADTDPVDVVSQFAAVGSLGYYDPATGAMVVRGSADTPNLRITLVHELTHALEDQHFELDRPALDDAFDESGLAFSALVEGSASRVDAAYSATLTDGERAQADAEQQALVAGIDLDTFPAILLAQQQFVYVTGTAFVESIFEQGGNAAIDRALRQPPTTSEQILEPDDWPDREVVVDVPVPEADEDAVDEGVVGQFLLHVLTSIDSGAESTPEWDGDSSVLWRDGELACLRMAIAGDLDEFEDSLGPWAAEVGADLSREGDVVTATSCR